MAAVAHVCMCMTNHYAVQQSCIKQSSYALTDLFPSRYKGMGIQCCSHCGLVQHMADTMPASMEKFRTKQDFNFGSL